MKLVACFLLLFLAACVRSDDQMVCQPGQFYSEYDKECKPCRDLDMTPCGHFPCDSYSEYCESSAFGRGEFARSKCPITCEVEACMIIKGGMTDVQSDGDVEEDDDVENKY